MKAARFLRAHWGMSSLKTWENALEADMAAVRSGRITDRLRQRIANGTLFANRRPSRRRRVGKKSHPGRTRVPAQRQSLGARAAA
jgi:hypothetical protein